MVQSLPHKLNFSTLFCRGTPEKFGLDKIAAQLKKFKISGLIVIGGFEVNENYAAEFI